LRQYYGDSADNWRPFGSPKDEILTIMHDVEGRYNSMLMTIGSSEKPVRWDIPQDFSNDTLFRLGNERTVIVIDPLSLYDRDVSDRLTNLYRSFDNEKALILAFAPFILPAPTSVMRVLLSYKAPKIVDYFFSPEFKVGKVYAKCGPDVGDQADIDRWLWHTLKPQFSGVQKSTRKHATAFTGAGG
jgi:hypothetical protein